jgi:hypothetical protein
MKLFRFFACVVVLCSMATLNSCQKDDINKMRTVSPISTKGTLEFRVVAGARQELPGVALSIAANEFDLHHGTYVATRVTDVKGRADFGLLNQGEYFYKAEAMYNGKRLYKEGIVQVQAGRELIRDVVLK